MRGSDPLVLANLLRKWQDLSFLTSGIPIRPFQVEFTYFADASNKSWGAQMRDSQLSGSGPVQTTSSSTLWSSRGQFWPPITVTVSQGHQLMIGTDNTTVVAYSNKQGGTHFHTLLYLVVDLFLWLQTQDIAILARHIPGCINVIGLVDRLSRLNKPITTK